LNAHVNSSESTVHVPANGLLISRSDDVANQHKRVCHVGNPTEQWAEIKRAVERRHLAAFDTRDVDELMNSFSWNSIDLIVVGGDVKSPPPHEICREIRQLGYTKPMLVITDAGDPIDAVLGLESGADAWIASNTDARAAVAQIRALLRRAEQIHAPAKNQDSMIGTIRVGNLLLCARSHELLIGQQPFHLSGSEFDLLWILAENAGEVVAPKNLLRALTGNGESPRSRIVNTNIARLRKRLGACNATRIKTIRAAGYMLCAESLLDSRRFRAS
jgi:DNA-binding response OmpR family regulator